MNKINILITFVMLMIIGSPCKAQKDDRIEKETWVYDKEPLIEEFVEEENDEYIYQFVEQMPEFEGGQKAMVDFISNNLKYPPRAVEQGIEGRVIVRVVVTAEGNVQDPEIVQGIDLSCDEEALRIVNLMPKWNPGKQSGEKVAVYYTIPIRFKFSEEQQHLALNRLSSLRSNLSLKSIDDIYDNAVKNKERIPEIIDTLLVIYKSREELQVNDSITELLIYYIGGLYHNSGKYKEAIKYIQKGIKLAPTNYHFYNIYGLCLSSLGKAAKGKAAERYCKDAFNNYYKALEVYPLTRKDIKSYPSRVHRNIGFLYIYKAHNTDDKSQKEMYFEKTIEHFEQIGINELSTFLCMNWAISLGYLAEYKPKEVADSLYHQAIGILQEEEESGILETYENYFMWGGALQVLGNRRKGEEADSLYRESIKLLEKALTFLPNINRESADVKNLRNCYMVLQYSYTKRACFKTGNEADPFFKIATDYGEKAIQLGAQPYNHACSYALMGNAEKAFPLLRQALKQKEITFKKVEDDTDWDKLRNHAEYKKLKKK